MVRSYSSIIPVGFSVESYQSKQNPAYLCGEVTKNFRKSCSCPVLYTGMTLLRGQFFLSFSRQVGADESFALETERASPIETMRAASIRARLSCSRERVGEMTAGRSTLL